MRFLPALCAAALFSFCVSAHAEALGIVTGPRTGTYFAIGRDIAAAAAPSGVRLTVHESEGSVDNIKRLNSLEHVEIGIVQADVMNFLRHSQNPDSRKMAEHLRMIMPLYQEEVQVLARNDIQSFKDLEGKRVVVGENGSGDMITAINLLAMMRITPSSILRLPPPQGVLSVLDGRADAVFIVGGKPVKLFKNLESLGNSDNPLYRKLLTEVHFLPLSDPRMLEEYRPAAITPKDYSFVNEPIPTIATTAVLVTFDFSTPGALHPERCREVHALTQALLSHLEWLKAHGHPKWQEVSATSSSTLWPRDICAWRQPAEHRPKTRRKHRPHHSHRPLTRDLRQSMKDR